MGRIVVTGASGFVGQNLVLALEARSEHEVLSVGRDTPWATLDGLQADHIIHLAGANRPPTEDQFETDNVIFAKEILSRIRPSRPGATFHYASTIQINRGDFYGESKKAGEALVAQTAPEAGWAAAIWRLPNLFGKWGRPNYNSFVATFMDQAARGHKFSINDPNAPVALLYIDDLIDMFLKEISQDGMLGVRIIDNFPTSQTTVGEVANLIESFQRNRDQTFTPDVGTALCKQLHATFLSFLDQPGRVFRPKGFFSDTGSFCELYKGTNFGQVSVLTIAPGESRGNHYHHTKVENFHLASGRVALIESDARGGTEIHRTISAGESFWTRPGWVHTLQNSGNTPAVLVIWANEIFDHDHPDTFKLKKPRSVGPK